MSKPDYVGSSASLPPLQTVVREDKNGVPHRTAFAKTSTSTTHPDHVDGRGGNSVSSAPASAWVTSGPGMEYFEPIRDAHSTPGHKRRSSGNATSAAPNQQPSPASFPDQIAASALAGTVGFLRMAGGLTLSTTGALVAPPLHVTRTLILPNLWAASLDYIAHNTPDRVKDWFRIIRSSFMHIVTGLKNTASGKVFRSHLVDVGVDLVKCVSSDEARQMLTDGVACVVKLAEATHTPEFQAFLDHLAVLGCRTIDAASSGRNKQLVHDFTRMCWSGCELLADPSTTLALAETTAYLCHALEMEDANFESLRSKMQAAQQRYARNQQQNSTYGKPKVWSDPNATVEQVILSSLGVAHGEETGSINNELGDPHQAHDHASVPSNVHVSSDQAPSIGAIGHDFSDQRSLRDMSHDDSTRPNTTEGQSSERRVHENVDVAYLEEQINARAAKLDANRLARTPRVGSSTDSALSDDDLEDIGVVSTVADTDEESPGAEAAMAHPQRRKAQLLDGNDHNDKNEDPDLNAGQVDSEWAHPEHAAPLEGEESLQYFHRILNEFLDFKRKEAVIAILGNEEKTKDRLIREGRVKRPHQSGIDESGTLSLKQQLEAIRSELARDPKHQKDLSQMNEFVKKNRQSLFTVSFLIALIVLTFCAFSCYGFFVFFFPNKASFRTVSRAENKPNLALPTSHAQEVVIRVVKEVVHVDQHQNLVGCQSEPTVFSTDDIGKLGECIAAVT
jgi:hypothetical protein